MTITPSAILVYNLCVVEMMLCIVIGCSKRSGRDKDVSFYRIPKVITHKGKCDYELSKKRRDGFIAAIFREGLTEKVLESDRICSRHLYRENLQLFMMKQTLIGCLLCILATLRNQSPARKPLKDGREPGQEQLVLQTHSKRRKFH